MPSSTHTRPAFTLNLIGSLAILLLLGAGCQQETDHGEPLIRAQSFISKPPSAYSRSTSDEEIIADLRVHLKTIASKMGDPEILAYVFFWTAPDDETFDRLVREYTLHAGEASSIQMLYGPSDFPVTYADVLPIDVTSSASLASYLAPRFAKRGIIPTELRIGSFAIWGHASQFVSMWQENDRLIRGVAILGTQGNVVQHWTTIHPSQRLRP